MSFFRKPNKGTVGYLKRLLRKVPASSAVLIEGNPFDVEFRCDQDGTWTVNFKPRKS
jgi:hypothetical protein